VNTAFYGEKVSISSLLEGDYPAPKGADILYRAMNDVLFGGQSFPFVNAATPGYSPAQLSGSMAASSIGPVQLNPEKASTRG